MDMRSSQMIFPRPMGAFSKHTSLNFDMMRAKIYLGKEESENNLFNWIAYGLTGLLMGFIAAMI